MAHTVNPGYKPGDHWAVCDQCGFDFYASQLLYQWDNLVVCSKCYDTRQPQDFVRGRKDKIVADPPLRPPTTETTVEVTYVDDGDPSHDVPTPTFGG